MPNPVIFPGSTKSTWSFSRLERLTVEDTSHDPSIFNLRI
jgi:hypothetical protein